MMTSAQVVETSVNVITNSPSQDYTHPGDHNLPTSNMTPGFQPLTVLICCWMFFFIDTSSACCKSGMHHCSSHCSSHCKFVSAFKTSRGRLAPSWSLWLIALCFVSKASKASFDEVVKWPSKQQSHERPTNLKKKAFKGHGTVYLCCWVVNCSWLLQLVLINYNNNIRTTSTCTWGDNRNSLSFWW